MDPRKILEQRQEHGIPEAEARLDRAREADDAAGLKLGDRSDEHQRAYDDLERRVFAAHKEVT